MRPKRLSRIVATFVVSLLMTIALLVGWVIYIVRSQAKINQLATGVGLGPENFHWLILALGCVLFAIVIGGMSYQLAQALSERRYAYKQSLFVANITHELKSPLAAIKLQVETLQQADAEEDLEEEDRRRFLAHVLDQTERMRRLVDNVLEAARLTGRRRSPQLDAVELASFFEDYFRTTAPRVEAQGVSFESAIATGSTVLATEDRLWRVMDNLVDNALRFVSRGGLIRCEVGDHGEGVLITVEDDGVGIPKGELRRIFDRFYQIGGPTGGTREGSGLGLAIVRGLVKEMKGSIQAVSREDRPGSRFEVELPPMALEGQG